MTFIALECTSKLVVAWHLGKRDRVNTEDFISKIRWATAPGWWDLSTDAFQPYDSAIDAGLYNRANHAEIVKLFSTHLDRVSESYSPAKFVSVAKDATEQHARFGPRRRDVQPPYSPIVSATEKPT